MSALIELLSNPTKPTGSHFRMFGVLGTWMEADVVGATVRNALTQGCERVYLVDNGSSDSTVEAASQAGAILARSFLSDQYDEGLRLRHMNDVVSEISESETDQHIWWLYLDADEFPHGPSGMTLHEYLSTLDLRCRVVGMRCFDHYPSALPYCVQDRHPLDFQPFCEELALPMCPSRHRKHPLLRHDKGAAPIQAGEGFHLAHCEDRLYEPSEPAFLHHFPFRNVAVTRARLDALWAKDSTGITRALKSRDVHMLTRHRSIDAVYARDWNRVENFVPLDPMYSQLDVQPPLSGVDPRPWGEVVEEQHQQVLRWYSTVDAWNYGDGREFRFGDDLTYQKGMAFLDGHGTIEDWGCGFAYAKRFVTKSHYIGLDGSSAHADRRVDLQEYRSSADCIFVRHVLEHNAGWRRILANAVKSFKKRMVLIVFTPFSNSTRVIATSTSVTSIPIPDISFRKEDLISGFEGVRFEDETLRTDTQYGTEHIFYLEKHSN